MPTLKQINDISGGTSGSATYTSNFSPVMGGAYFDGSLYSEATRGYWWGSIATNGAVRYYLRYESGNLYTNDVLRYRGAYIRCVSEEKDVSDLTYMQDMTPSVATFTGASPHHPSRTLCHSECIKSLIL